MHESTTNNGVVYRCIYRIVWCPKYRRPVIEGAVDQRLKQLAREFTTLRYRLPTLWTNSYFVANVGDATLEPVKRYVENQRNA